MRYWAYESRAQVKTFMPSYIHFFIKIPKYSDIGKDDVEIKRDHQRLYPVVGYS